jgi:peptidoglycan/xylan/chitin deacetylase (PgdA/CDA1 family)
MYHAVNDLRDPLSIQVTPDRLRKQLHLLRSLGLRGVSMAELLAGDGPGGRLVGLTFDDGYTDFATTAVPILAEFDFSATVFMVAGHVAGSNEWDPPPRRELMTADQLKRVHAAGHEVGSHGWHHKRLAGLPSRELVEEVHASKAALENIIAAPVHGFCYPYGVVAPESLAAVRSEYEYACAVKVSTEVNPWLLPRFHVGEADGSFRLVVKMAVRPFRERLQRGTR